MLVLLEIHHAPEQSDTERVGEPNPVRQRDAHRLHAEYDPHPGRHDASGRARDLLPALGTVRDPGQSNGAAGSIAVPILFKNISQRTCTLQGYPGVAGLNAAGQQVVQAVRTTFGGHTGVPAAVSLAPSQTASAPVQGRDVPVGTATTCTSYPKLLITPPGETHSQQVIVTLPGCNGLRVGPVVAGTMGL